MSRRDIGMEILEGIREIKAYKAGRGALRTHKLARPAPARKIRAQLQLSQAEFASLMGVIHVPGQDLSARPTWEADQLAYSTQMTAPGGQASDSVHYNLTQGRRALQADETYTGAIVYDNHWIFNKQ